MAQGSNPRSPPYSIKVILFAVTVGQNTQSLQAGLRTTHSEDTNSNLTKLLRWPRLQARLRKYRA